MERHLHGIVVRGADAISVDEIAVLVNRWAVQGWTEFHPGIARELGADFAVTNDVHREAWLAELAALERRESA